MAIGTITTSRSYMTKQVTSLSKTLTEKTTQLATGKVSSTYGGIGNNRLLDLELSQRVGRIEAYQETIVHANLHIETLNLTLDRLEDLRIDGKSAIDPNDFELQADGQTRSQATAEILLYEAVNLLNTEVAGHYLYGGSNATNDPVAGVKEILDGTLTRAGLRQVVDEFYQANLGPNDNGRLDVSALTTNYAGPTPTDSTFTIAEDGAHDFGFDISAVSSNLTNVSITGPAGGVDPDSFDIQFTGQPELGESITLEFTMPPAHDEPVVFTFTANSIGGEDDTFAIGADLEETANNLRDAMIARLEKEAQTTLRAASDEWAANSFFDTFAGGEPVRVDGPPFDTATGLVSGAANTVIWYTGENSATTDARADKTAVIDTNLSVNYGARANEDGLTDVIKALATFISADFSDGYDLTKLHYSALSDRMRTVLEPDTADQSGIVDITTEISVAYRTVQSTDDRHDQMRSSYLGTIDTIEGVDNELLAAEILQLQTNIEASYRASSIVYQLSIVDYL
ncbi:flagellar protein [Roseibium sp.]|uniref:flagellar protein n=1 Tax=Roseibium sp. TaxID=1936156 RepID=UPI003A96F134